MAEESRIKIAPLCLEGYGGCLSPDDFSKEFQLTLKNEISSSWYMFGILARPCHPLDMACYVSKRPANKRGLQDVQEKTSTR